MTWIYVLLVIAVVAAVLGWMSSRQRRHAGDFTLEQARRDAERHPLGGGDLGGGGFG